MSADEVRVGRRRIPISHADRVLLPEAGMTKLDLARYYAEVGAAMVAHLRDRPLALQVFPAGVDGDGHFLKNAPRHFPAWVKRVPVPKREGGENSQVVANDPATLVYLAGQNAITPHVGTARADRLDRPDRVVFDLDPDAQSFTEVRAAARALGELLRDLGFEPFAMTTGSRGLHVDVAVRRTLDTGAVQGFARAVGARIAAEHPDDLTVEFRKQKRGGRIFVDVNRNGYGQHAVAPYAVRSLSNAPVATPLHWDELDDSKLGPQRWTAKTLPERLASEGDPWAEIGRTARDLRGVSL